MACSSSGDAEPASFAFLMSSWLTSVRPSKADMVLAVLEITISARWVLIPSAVQAEAMVLKSESSIVTDFRISLAWEILRRSSSWARSCFF